MAPAALRTTCRLARADNHTTPSALSSLVTVHYLTAQNAPGALHDPDGQALRRLGLTARHTGHYLVRPDGHIGHRAGGADATGLARYLGRWLPDSQTSTSQSG